MNTLPLVQAVTTSRPRPSRTNLCQHSRCAGGHYSSVLTHSALVGMGIRSLHTVEQVGANNPVCVPLRFLVLPQLALPLIALTYIHGETGKTE
eukprot:1190342-Prorocentrum_minimum.AAC.2